MTQPDPESMTEEQIIKALERLGFIEPHRAAVLRTGEREPISPLVRQLVYRRDNWTCQHCGAQPWAKVRERRSGVLELDHIIPWSNLGPDRSDNLRTLCHQCNTERSNWVTGNETPTTPIVRICAPCLIVDITERPETSFEVYCGSHSHYSWALDGWQIL